MRLRFVHKNNIKSSKSFYAELNQLYHELSGHFDIRFKKGNSLKIDDYLIPINKEVTREALINIIKYIEYKYPIFYENVTIELECDMNLKIVFKTKPPNWKEYDKLTLELDPFFTFHEEGPHMHVWKPRSNTSYKHHHTKAIAEYVAKQYPELAKHIQAMYTEYI